MNEYLNIGLILNSKQLKRYQEVMIEKIMASGFCHISLCLLVNSASEEKSRWHYFLYDLYQKIDRQLFGKELYALQNTSGIEETVQGIRVFKPEEQAALKDVDLDLLLDLTEETNIDFPKANSKYGIWSLLYPRYPAAFWEVVDRHAYSEVTLACFSDNITGNYEIERFFSTTDLKSPCRNLDMLRWRSQLLVLKNLKLLYQEKNDFFKDKREKVLSREYQPPYRDFSLLHTDLKLHFHEELKRRIPVNSEMFGVLWKVAKKFIWMLFRKYCTKEQWGLLYRENTGDQTLFSFHTDKALFSPEGRHWADPFVIDDEEKSYIFYEEFVFNGKGDLHVITYDANRKIFSDPQEVLSRDYHLSYPFIFKYDGSFYMIPESSENRSIDLYIATDFPYAWKKVKVLMDDLFAVDTTLHFYNGKWWMFTNIAPEKGFSPNDALYIYYCNNFLKDEWEAHKMNPVIMDTSIARNAGRIVEKDDVLYRPSQNCSGYYGRSLNFNKIELLTEETYRESRIAEIDLGSLENIQAVHTYNRSKRFSIVDANFVKLKL